MPTDLSGSVALVTGALTGIGRATAVAFAAAGAHVVVSGRRDEAGAQLAATLRALGGQAEYIHTDVRHEDEVAALVDGTVQRFGRLDAAVNNAGCDGEIAAVPDTTQQQYSACFDTNVLGTLLSMKHELRAMRQQGTGSIINLTSIYGERGARRMALYAASKHAVIGLTRSAALEAAAYGVRVNAVGPGPVQTEMLDRVTGNEQNKTRFLDGVPLGRAGRPEEIAETITHLASAATGFLTGQTIIIDGGMHAA